MTTERIYNHKRDPFDPRDRKLTLIAPAIQLPASVDLRNSFMPPVYDQGNLGSCSANALGGAMEYEIRKQNEPDFMPSRLFIYFNERAIEGTISEDDGACLRDGMKTLAVNGVCSEVTWPYNIDQFTMQPSNEAYAEGKKHLAVAYLSVNQDPNSIKAALAGGQPVALGFQVYESFETDAVATTGLAPMPNIEKEQCLGGHAVLCVGYKADGTWIMRNSWGVGWGISGYFYLPPPYLVDPDLASDFWVVKTVE